MSNPWKKTPESVAVLNLSDIMSEEFAKGLQVKEDTKFAETISDELIQTADRDIAPDIMEQIEGSNVKDFCDSDAIIAKVLQCQFDKEHDDEIQRVEKKRNGDAKVSVSYDNYRHVPSGMIYDSESEEDVDTASKKDWDRFETNEKEFASIPKRGYIMKDGEKVTKHDSVLSGRRNAYRVMSFPPEFCTGDGAGFDMKLPNYVFNQLKAHSRTNHGRKHKKLDRKDVQATAEMGLDETTKMILYKLVNTTGMLEEINGIISTGKESIVMHANSDASFSEMSLPKECAVKIFKTTLNEFKTRDKYIESDYRFKDRFSKQNPRKIVHMWAEKEMHNMMRLQRFGINCPDMICLKKHILVMSFIGKDNVPAPKLKDAILKDHLWPSLYNEVVGIMHKMFKEAHMIHADFSEYNILWHENKCWVIDVSQSVEPDHPRGLEFLLRDCRNICHFFKKKGVPDVKTPEDLFKSITGFEEIDMNLLDGVHSTYNSLSSRFEIEPDDARHVAYPFDYCWQRSNEKKAGVCARVHGKSDQSNSEDETQDDEFEEMWKLSMKQKCPIDTASNFGNEIPIDDVDVEGGATKVNEIKQPDIIKHEEINTISSSKNKS